MFENIKEFLNQAELTIDVNGEPTSHDLKVAVMVLLTKLAHSDNDFNSEELQAISENLAIDFEISDSEIGEIIQIADFLVRDEAKVEQFITAIHDGFNSDQKQLIVSLLWKIVLSDEVINEAEVILVNNISKQIGLTLEQSVRARQLTEIDRKQILGSI